MTIKIGFGTTILDRGLSGAGIDGIGQYCQELLCQFSKDPQAIEVCPFSFGVAKSPVNAKVLPSYSHYLTKAFLNLGGHTTAQQFFDSVDLIHCTDQLIPIITNKPLVATVMDTIPLSHPEFIKTHSRLLKPYLWKKLTRRADHIITISEFSKREITNLMGIEESRITSIPLGVDERFFKKIPEHEVSQTLRKLNIHHSFFLFLGSIQPRKNLQNIISAHSILPHSLATQFPLVIAGKIGWDDGEILKAIHRGVSEGRCIWLDYVSDFEKRCLLQSASALVFASLYEGFGLPILEAYASGTAVITSTVTSMPEVAGNASLIIDPTDAHQIYEALHQILEDQTLRSQLISQGKLIASKYTWEQCAKQTAEIYKKIL